MKEKIYTIPVTEAYGTDCECPMCVMEKKLENENLDYILGPSLMEPDGRIETNNNGFCRHHYEQLYNKQVNRLGLGLIIDTHLCEQNNRIRHTFEKKLGGSPASDNTPLHKKIISKLTPKPSESDDAVNLLINQLSDLENRCVICNRLNHTMDRYIDVILYLWFKEPDFRTMFNSSKGLCLKHLRQLLQGTIKYLGKSDRALFVRNLIDLQMKNMDRIQEEVNWFTKKFDYRYNDAPWGNSKDAVIRSIQKLAGYCELK